MKSPGQVERTDKSETCTKILVGKSERKILIEDLEVDARTMMERTRGNRARGCRLRPSGSGKRPVTDLVKMAINLRAPQRTGQFLAS
jgi:hypothetical protein